MGYSELIKNFERIRDYMREFYVYGFKSREEYSAKSARSYDNERRRIESWLGGYMAFRQNAAGKNVFLSVDSRSIPRNPLHKAFKARSFTSKDITLHFYILDILAEGNALSFREIADRINDEYLSHFSGAFSLDESTIRKKLKEYESLGLLQSEKSGREVLYRRTGREKFPLESWADALEFYAEEDPVGVIGSYLLDKLEDPPDSFRFKHHYILHALDSQVLYDLLCAIGQRRRVTLTVRSPRNGRTNRRDVCPLRVFVSTQTGRQYLLGYRYERRRLLFFRLDTIRKAALGEPEPEFARYLGYCEGFQKKLWGVSLGERRQTDHIEMTIHAAEGEGFIVQRLKREKRCGTVAALDGHTYRFSADVYDAMEMLPWLRTFIGRITSLTCSNQAVTDTFYGDLEEMRRMYGEDSHAFS